MHQIPNLGLDCEVTAHDSSPRDESLQMIANPPPEIGQPISAGGNLPRGSQSVSTSGQPTSVATALALTVLPYLAVGAILFELPGSLLFPGAAIIGAIAIRLSSRLSRVDPSTSYLGPNGFSISTFTSGLVQTKTFCFTNAEHLFCSEVIHWVNDQPSGLGFCFSWTNAAGRELMEISGSKYSNDKRTGTEHLYELSQAAEGLWTKHKMESLNALAKAGSPMHFQVKGNGTVSLLKGAIVFKIPGTKATWNATEMASPRIENGCIFFQRKDASNLTNRGRASFSMGLLSDRKCFLSLLETHTGLQVDDVHTVDIDASP